ncbi:tetratricopeptide repeat domain protein [Acanthamoeba castellanii str. Neff]|uniref:Tetratricopeptide repeat domain protein n=1 Tax=Acanthamoeba castellanii (strain ATCC 30010 / Neff) TaxID=1257118 RepID=L8GGW2_ACACF|nr:tetratricopeptide repeat domain protein [Acanthamoeba castellanii str. Neff]ELR11983.1 tetratricopeptide repeat domain protein [Acanthamoeba castellanii str. Neff]
MTIQSQHSHQDENLDVLDQCILLSLCLDVKNNNPRHGLTTEEMFPYVRRVQKNPNNWMVHSTCLLLKSRLEFESTKTADRAVLQMQTLVEQFYDEEKDLKKELHDVIRERSRYLFALAFPCRLTLQKELGERFLSMGMAASALQIFEQFEMWENVITCYRVMGKDKKAEQVVMERLDAKPTPELWCLLGDLTEEKTTAPYIEQARKKLEELLAHITSKVTNQHEIWATYAKYHEGFGNKEKALDARLKQMRSASPVDWQNDEKKFKTVAEVSLLLVDTYLMQDEEDLKKSLFSAKLHLRGVLKKAEPNFKGTEHYAKLEEKLAIVLDKEQAFK